LAKDFPKVCATSKRPSVTCSDYKLGSKTLITRENMSCTPFNVQRSKFIIAELNFAKVGKTYNYFVFFTNLQNTSCENYFLEKKTSLGHKCKHRPFIHKLSTNCMWI
jgi:hypothetical protein